MKVKLISYSKPTDSISNDGIDNAQELVAVSYTHLTLPTKRIV